MNKTIILLASVYIFISCAPDTPFIPQESINVICDENYYIKNLEDDIDAEHMFLYDNSEKAMFFVESGLMIYNTYDFKKTDEYLTLLGTPLYHTIRPDKKIWLNTSNNNSDIGTINYLIDIEGNVLLEKEIDHGGMIVSTPSNGFFMVHNEMTYEPYFESIGIYTVSLFDSFGNIEWKKSFEIENGEVHCITLLKSSELLIGGYADSVDQPDYEPTTKPYLAKIDTLGNIIFEKKLDFEGMTYGCTVKKILEKNESTYHVVLKESGYTNVVEVDTSGMINWSSEINTTYVGKGNRMFYTKDNDLIVLGLHKLLCLDLDGNILWEHDYNNYNNSHYFESIHELVSGDMIIGGSTDVYDGVNKDPRTYRLFMKIDKDGNTCY